MNRRGKTIEPSQAALRKRKAGKTTGAASAQTYYVDGHGSGANCYIFLYRDSRCGSRNGNPKTAHHVHRRSPQGYTQRPL